MSQTGKYKPLKKTKTKKCDWCYKRKKVENMYYIGIVTIKHWWICGECNYKHDII